MLKVLEETWKDIVGYENKYQVSNLGRIKTIPHYVSNHTGQILLKEHISKGYKTKKGYLCIELKGKSLRVHRLVATAFLPKVKGKNQVNHIDGNKQNNRIDNLEWCDNRENQKHAYKIGLQHRRENAGRKKKKVGKYNLKNELIQTYESISQATKENKIKGNSSVRNAILRNTKLYNYYWRFIND